MIIAKWFKKNIFKFSLALELGPRALSVLKIYPVYGRAWLVLV